MSFNAREPCQAHYKFACDKCSVRDAYDGGRWAADEAMDAVIEGLCPGAGFYQRIKIKAALDAWIKLHGDTIKEDHVDSCHRDHSDD